jgi:hypothetical protein
MITESPNKDAFQSAHENSQDLNQMINSMSKIALDEPASFASGALPSQIGERLQI